MEGILAGSAAENLAKLLPVVTSEIGSGWGFDDDLKKLQNTISTILPKLADAEEKQLTFLIKKETDVALTHWIKMLKDAAYDAGVIMDKLSYQTMRRQHEGNSWKKKAHDFFTISNNQLLFHHEMAGILADINKRLDKLAMNIGKFHLLTTPSNATTSHGYHSSEQSWKTPIEEPEIIGRDGDKNEMIKILTRVSESLPSSTANPNENQEKVSAVTIVGVAGVGKTTLAQLVYNDDLVKEHFDLRAWVCVSKDADVEAVLVEILESITPKMLNGELNFDLLARKVREVLSGKTYLLVLDDLRSEASYKHWERLKSLLQVGAQGSTVLITTRDAEVANRVNGSIPIYHLKRLTDDECWSIIAQKAFSHGGAVETPVMTGIGKEIARKCRGLPLAAKFLGELMHSRSQESDWSLIIENKNSDTSNSSAHEIMQILKLSYNHLSSPLKKCFSYCSIFPKGYEISRETLIQLWMAEGFIPDEQDKRSKEDIGGEFFESLLSCSFFDAVKENKVDDIIFDTVKKNEVGDIKTCKIHDLVHDFAQSVVGDQECVSYKASDLIAHVSGIRRLRLTLDEELSPAFSLRHGKKLRTVIILEPSNSLNVQSFKNNDQLRVLHLVGLGANLPELSKWIGKLKLLRYLNLTSFNLSKVKNDKAIHGLYYLETLVLSGCQNVQNLLSNIGSLGGNNRISLENLRNLDISYTDIEELPDSVTSLCNLQRLDLNHCDRLTTLPNSISGLTDLKYFDMSFTPIQELPGFVTSLHNLKTLDFSYCERLKSLPERVEGLYNLRVFNFYGCPLLKRLPQDFGSLTQLRNLNLGDTLIKVLPESCDKLINLETVNLYLCQPPKEVTNWKKLRVLEHFTGKTPAGIQELRLETLQYRVTKERSIEELENLNFCNSLVISDLRNVNSPDAEGAYLKGNHNLRELTLQWGKGSSAIFGTKDYDRRSSKVLEALQPPTSLTMLVICNFMGCLPTWMCDPSCLPHLKVLELESCSSIEQLPASIGQLTHLTHLQLKGMSSLKSLDLGGFPSLYLLHLSDMHLLEELRYSSDPPCLRYLTISGCRRLTEIPSFPSLEYLVLDKVDPKLVCSVGRSQTSLTELFLENIEDLIYFPVSILQNSHNLQTLQISGCNQFERFGVNDGENDSMALMLGPDLYNGFLKNLGFCDCPVLKFLPDLRFLTSLRRLLILNCPQVKENLTYDLRSLSFLQELDVDFIENDKQQDPSSSLVEGELPLPPQGENEWAIWIKELLHLAPDEEQGREKFDLEMERDQTRSKNKWRPTKEQEGILELLYECGLRHPTMQQNQQITQKLNGYEMTEELNVYLWFQRYKPEERQEQTSSSLMALVPTIMEGLKYDNTGKMLPINSEKQRELLPSVEENIQVWACPYVRPNIAYIGESPPEIQNQQGTSLPTMSTSVSSTQGDVSQPESQDNTGDLKKSKLYKLFRCM